MARPVRRRGQRVMAIMQREPGWKVESVKWMRTIAAPEHLEGRL